MRTYIHAYIHTYQYLDTLHAYTLDTAHVTHTDRQTDKQTDRHTDIHTGIHTYAMPAMTFLHTKT